MLAVTPRGTDAAKALENSNSLVLRLNSEDEVIDFLPGPCMHTLTRHASCNMSWQ